MVQTTYNVSEKRKTEGASEEVNLEVLIAKKFADKAHAATQKGQDFNITFAEFRDMVLTGVCYYTNIPVTNLNKASIERINPLKGYIPGNVCMVDADVNMFKGATIDVFMRTRFQKNLPKCLSEILNICNKMSIKLGYEVRYCSKSGLFVVHSESSLRAMANNEIIVNHRNSLNGIIKKGTVVKIESKRSKYYGKPAVIIKNYTKVGAATEYKVKLLTDGCPKIKVKQVSVMDLE